MNQMFVLFSAHDASSYRATLFNKVFQFILVKGLSILRALPIFDDRTKSKVETNKIIFFRVTNTLNVLHWKKQFFSRNLTN